MRNLKLVIMTAFVALSVSACATNRSVIPIAAPVGEQPKSGALAKIGEVRDLRQFSINPGDPSMPSLGSADEIQDAKVTGRAVARKRNTFGQALGDVALPETVSVASLVRDAARKALQDKGYMVVDEGSPDSARALPLAIDVQEFWAWMQPGFTSLTFTFNSALGLKGGGLLVTDPSVAKSQTVVTSAFGTESVWTQTVQNGVNEMTEQIKLHIKPAAGAPLTSQLDNPAGPAGTPGS